MCQWEYSDRPKHHILDGQDRASFNLLNQTQIQLPLDFDDPFDQAFLEAKFKNAWLREALLLCH